MSGWITRPHGLESDEALAEAVAAYHRELYATRFKEDPAVNHRLPVHVRNVQHSKPWRIALLLTPWMLARLWTADTTPPVAIPDGWSAEDRRESDYTVLGPAVALEQLGGQRAHLNYAPPLGHYLLQPLVLSMEGYSDADAVFAAREEVLRTRQARREQLERESGFSRRAFICGLGRRDRQS